MTEILDDDNNNNTETREPNIDTTPNIEFQINKFDDNEYFNNKYIPENALFTHLDTMQKIKNFYINNIDIPMLVNGRKGIGKLSSILGLLQHLPCYLYDNYNTKSNTKSNDNSNTKINNIKYFKVLDVDYNKILFFDNIFIINMEILNSNTEIMEYLKYIYQIAKSSNITIYNLDYDEDNVDKNSNHTNVIKPIDKKIIIITHIDKCNLEAQHYIAFMLDKITTYVSYIFTTQSINIIDKKIISSCAPITFRNLDETQFVKVFNYNFKKSLNLKNINLTLPHVKKIYQIYISNNYNIGNTIAQFKYYLAKDGLIFLKDIQNTKSLIYRIAENFIQKYLLEPDISNAIDIRKFLYVLLSLNMKLIIFIKEVVNQLLNIQNYDNTKKTLLIEKAGKLSTELSDCNKEIVIIEAFVYDIMCL